MTAQTWTASQYAENGRFVADLASEVFDLLAPLPGEAILDLACGDGALTTRIAAAGAQVFGVDSSASMVEASRARGLRAEIVDAEQLEFTAQFDAVFSNAALHWIRNQQAVLSGVYRALKPGGRFIAELGGFGNIAAIRVALLAVLKQWDLDADQLEHNHFPTPSAYRELLEGAGFIVDQIDLVPRPTPLPQSGMRGWLQTFRRGLLDRLPEKQRALAIEQTEALLQPVLSTTDGQWIADYVRLRFRAYK